MALNYVHTGWYKGPPLEKVIRNLSEVRKIVGEVSVLSPTEIDLKRVYIPKANGKVRPLGVPTMA